MRLMNHINHTAEIQDYNMTHRNSNGSDPCDESQHYCPIRKSLIRYLQFVQRV